MGVGTLSTVASILNHAFVTVVHAIVFVNQ